MDTTEVAAAIRNILLGVASPWNALGGDFSLSAIEHNSVAETDVFTLDTNDNGLFDIVILSRPGTPAPDPRD